MEDEPNPNPSLIPEPNLVEPEPEPAPAPAPAPEPEPEPEPKPKRGRGRPPKVRKPSDPTRKPGTPKFQKGHAKIGGRQPGGRNHTTRILKECILIAAEIVGSDGKGRDGLIGYLTKIARKDRRAFAMLLGKVLPLQIEARGEVRLDVTYKTVEEVRKEMENRGITIDAVKQVLHQPPKQVQ